MIPLSVLIYEKGASGVPQTSGRADSLGGRLDSYEHTSRDDYGFEGMRCSFGATETEALDWLRPEQLMRACEVFAPRSDRVWEGCLTEIEVRLGRITLRLALKDMANRLVVRYNTPGGDHSPTSIFESADSQYLYGRKDRVIPLSGTSATGAANRAQTALNLSGFPRSTTPSESGTGGGGEIGVTLRFEGWYSVLTWVLTTIASETVVNNKVQIAALIAAFNAVNAFLSTDTSGMTATLPDDVEWIEPDTPIRDKIERLLSQGDSSNNVLSWGVYEERRFCVEVSAAATPETVHYYEHSRTGIITDPYGNVVDPWLVRPNRMAQVIDVLDVAPPPGAVDGATRKHVARVTCRISSSGVTVSLDPTEDASIDKILASPNGVATSDRQAAVDRALASSMRSRFESTENPSTYSGGVWQPDAGGTGVANGGIIDTGGGDITNTGGGDIDLGTGSGIGGTGSTGTTTTGGTPGALAKWDTPSKLKDAVADVDYVAPGSLGETIDDRVAALLVAGTGIGLSYNDPGNALTISATLTLSSLGAAPSDATYIVQTASSGLSAEQALGSLATGVMKSTTTTGVVSTMTGTSGRITEWSDGTTIGASTLIKSGAGVLTLSAASTLTLTLSGGSATLDFTTPSSGDVLQYDGAKFTPTAPTTGAPTNATYITQTANGTLTNEQALSSLSTGMVKVTTSTGVLSSVAGTSGRITEWSDGTTIGASTLIKSGAGVLTLSAASTQTITISGSGGGTLALAGGTLTLGPNLTTSGAGGTLTLSAGGSYTLTVPATGTAALGSGTTEQIAYWSSANVLGNAPIYYDVSNNRIGIKDSTPSYDLDVNATLRATSGISAGSPSTGATGGQVRAQGRIQTDEFFESAAGFKWDLGSYAAGGTLTAQGRVSISINGTTYYLLARTS